MRVILPKTHCKLDPAMGPLFFLAGPVQGGNGWQLECFNEMSIYLVSFYAAIPCWYEKGHPLLQSRIKGDEQYFDRQLTWERHYLDIAAIEGCIIFWLPCESEINPHRGPDPYAMNTRGELGEWRGRLIHNPSLHIVVGAEAGFPGLSQIQRNFSLATQTEFPIYETLSATVAAAVKKVKG